MTKPKRQQLSCSSCGRKGSRGFTRDGERIVCKATRACTTRQARKRGRPSKRLQAQMDRAAERAREVMRLKRAGWRNVAIAEALELSGGRVSQIISEHYAMLAAESKEDAEHLRTLELERLDYLHEQLWQFAQRTPLFHPETGLPLTYRDGHAAEGPPSLAAVNQLQKISESRRKLLGLDEPSEHRWTGTVTYEHGPMPPDRAAQIVQVLASVGALPVQSAVASN